MNLFNDFIKVDLKKNMGLYNLTDEFFCVYLNAIREKNNNVLVVVDTIFEANKVYNNLSLFTDNVYLFPMDDFLTSEALAISPDLMIKRLETINNILNKENVIVIVNLMGYLRYLPLKETYLDSILDLKVGSVIGPNELVSKLVSIGYTRDTLVTKTGEFGVRGYVIDIFPLNEENPIRIEFFDDEIESIRYFNVEDQKSIEKIDSIKINPIFEFLSSKNVLEEHFGKQKYLQCYEKVCNISAYLDNCITVFKDYDQIKTSYIGILNEVMDYKAETDTEFEYNYMFDFNELSVDFPLYYFSLNNYVSNDYVDEVVSFNLKPISNFNEDSEKINTFINKCIKEDKTVLICLKRFQIRSILKYLNMKIVETDFSNIKIGCVNIIESELNKGFIYNDLVVLTSFELFNDTSSRKKYITKFKYSSSIKDINKLSVGDYVVHNTHGIGRYNGIKTLTMNDITKDYLEVLYQGTDKIYIPVEKIELISKYSGREGIAPKINKLGGADWSKTKNRVKTKVNDIADKLLKLYAERESKKGFAFSKDCDMSKDFENDFKFDLTADQSRAIVQIKEDMESIVPMDRLLCGDVGFGKTEVAFVAAFKAILDSKQVLFLCPTTILSNQHYDNAKERFKNFPVNIGLLNRFTSPKEVTRVLNGLKDGTIDMVFGTHRLLSDDVILKDLGLLIIDEEQRFGVTHKEKIKEFKTNVDVLTLTATPIPRTLQMSLVGIRSLSLIETPPINRFPVQTYVVEENKQILKDAIYKELSREGQVFILYNRVQSIEEFASRIAGIVPDARIAVAHGQMNKTQLENTIIDFVNYEFDILICTTIIETGIDIPNVNTLIVIDADRFGLSQLYQLRGRVGRSNKFAYAYLMYQPFKSLTETAVKRLNVIKEFTELGSGFSIATRDLSIRGAGDILGSEQAGFIDSVGIDLYLRMLNDEINRRNENTENVEEVVEETANENKSFLNVTTHIDDSYVQEDDLKIEIHKIINSVDSREKFESVKLELEDRFGKISEDVIIYMYEEWFENLAKKLKVSNVHQNKNSIEIVFPGTVVSKFKVDEIFMDAYYVSNMFRFANKGSNLVIILDIIKLDKHPVYYLVELLDKIYSKFGKDID
ncbi:MAG: transcription-repair coupling factor [Bacilli bacterium]|nr:transcription-repair coupling factor [Bacilli bacterium]